MNDDRELDLLIDQWMAGGPTDNPERIKDEAMAKVTVTPQMRRTLLPGRLDMTAITRLAVVAILAASGTALLMTTFETSPAEEAVPAAGADAVADASQKASAFTGTSKWGLQAAEGQEVTDKGKVSKSGDAWSITLDDMSDPRLNGTLYVVMNRDFHGLQGWIASLSMRIDNEMGSWIGVGHGYEGRTVEGRMMHRDALLQGTGAYEGLTALMYTTPTEDDLPFSVEDVYRYDGLVFPGEPPRVPALPGAPSR